MSDSKDVLESFDRLIYGKTSAEMGTFIPGTSSRRQRKSSPDAIRQPYITEDEINNYDEKHKLEEKQQTLKAAVLVENFQKCRMQGQQGMSMLEDYSTVYGEFLNDLDRTILKDKVAAFEQYVFEEPSRAPLAIDSKKTEILASLKKENTIIIKGFTGCGKTTQVPQFILDECYRTKTPCNIVVTQPRRIAAISIAKRVAHERNWVLGTVVGYQVGLEHQTNRFTCLTYLTTGCLLEALVTKKSLKGYTHIIVDEIHERNEDTDLLLMVIRKFLRHTSTSCKVILMSATADARKFAKYFNSPVIPVSGVFRNAPIIEVESSEPHQVSVYYMDDLQKLPFMSLPPSTLTKIYEPKIDKFRYDAAVQLISTFDEKREILRYGRHTKYVNISSVRNAVLVFLPGIGEIETMHKCLVEHENKASSSLKNYWDILPLHSRITSEEQSRVFQSVSSLPSHMRHFRKIILSTNIAESSLTVPDTTYVIDFCLVKQLVTDPTTNFCSLKTDWAPKSSCVQRKGRVGRVTDGVVFRMVPLNFYNNTLPEDVTPEILRCPLEKTVLRTKLLDLGEPKALLANLIDSPRLDNIARTIATLKEVGALFLTAKGKVNALDGDLSYLGRFVSCLPIDVHLGKLIMLGHVFNILEECIIMAAGLSSKNIFTSPFQKKLFAYQMKMMWAEGSFSDSIAILNAYQAYKRLQNNEYFKRSGESEGLREKRWADQNCIQLKAIKEMDSFVKEIKVRLDDMGIEPPTGPNVTPLTESQKALLLRVVIFGAFYPNYFSRGAVSEKIDERESVKSLCGLDPYTTVRLQGFPPDQPGKAYIRQIKSNLTNIFQILEEDDWNARISFDSQRVFIHFHQEGNSNQIKKLPGRICLPVYLAIKQKQLGSHFMVDLIEKSEAEHYIYRVEESARRLLNASDGSSTSGRSEVPYALQVPPPRVPQLHENEIPVSVCHVVSPRHFYCHRLDDRTKSDNRTIYKNIHDKSKFSDRWDLSMPIHKGKLVVGPYSMNGEPPDYYRAKVLSVESNVPAGERRVRLYFIDYGNAADSLVRDLRIIPDALLSIPPLAMECNLTGVGPSFINNPKGDWTSESKKWFESLTQDQTLTAKVFSVVNDITTLDLIGGGGNWDNSLANQLINHKFAVKVQESYVSKLDNESRKTAQSSSKPKSFGKPIEERRVEKAELVVMESDVAESRRRIIRSHRLLGPYSPLEMQVYGKPKSLLGNPVKIEDDSVNSVMLDDQPGDSHERVLVAAYIGTQLTGNRVVARSTTLLPNIPGLPAILTLLFAPRVEFRADANRSRLVGAICGLGYDMERNNQSFYPEHDMEIAFDSEFDLADVLLINKMRFWLNSVMGPATYSNHQAAPTRERILEVNQKMNQMLFELIHKPRNDVEVIPTTTYKWGLVRPDTVIRADVPQSQLEDLIPLHDYIKIVTN